MYVKYILSDFIYRYVFTSYTLENKMLYNYIHLQLSVQPRNLCRKWAHVFQTFLRPAEAPIFP